MLTGKPTWGQKKEYAKFSTWNQFEQVVYFYVTPLLMVLALRWPKLNKLWFYLFIVTSL